MYSFTLLFKYQFISVTELYIIFINTQYIPSYVMSTHIVQNAYKEFIELQDFVHIFFNNFRGRTQRPPLSFCNS